MSDRSFVHLHVHSHFSLLDGCIHQSSLVERAVEFGMPALAITDHGSLFGAVEFYLAAKDELKPILGTEAYVSPADHRDRESEEGKRKSHHLTLLARNLEGYHNLIKLSSASYVDGFYRKPRMDDALLKTHGSGVVALSGCMGGYIAQALAAGDRKRAEAKALHYRELFGKDGFYLELMRNGVEGQEPVNQALIEMSRATGIPLVATNDVHYLERSDAVVHEVATCISTGKTLKDDRRMKMETDQFYFRSPEEMRSLFEDVPEAIDNSLRIADLCDVTLDFNNYHLPEFHPETGEEPIPYLKRLCEEGLIRLYGEITPPVRERLDKELEVIISMGFATYFLIVWDFIRYAREQGIPVGPGRGSAAGSIVAYALSITKVDPLKYDLLFERFLNSSRVSMPDIDIDFCRDGRERVIRYVQEKYGESNVCQIVTFGTMKARAAVRDAGRVLDVDLGTVDTVAKMIPSGPKATLEKALEEEPELTELRKKDPAIDELFDISLKIEGLNRHASTHAAGVVITDRPLTEYVPLCRVQGEVNTQYQMTVLEMIGLLKMDFLGLKNLTIMDKAVKLIRETRGVEVDLDTLPLNDPATYALLQRGRSAGVFQLESDGMRKLLMNLKPDSFEDIIACLALYRPGPLKSGMVDTYVERKHGREPVEYLHDSLKEILEDTYGVIVYQEQVMRISNVLAGFTLNDADALRKAMGKKKKEVMAKFRTMFVEGAEKKGVDPAKAGDIYDKIEYFAGYGFNKSHSTAYGVVTFQTAWLKAHYPVEFMAALMSCDTSDSDKIAEYRRECGNLGIKVLGPDFNESDHDFTPLGDDTIRFGLGAVKGVGDKAIETIVEARRKVGRFDSIQSMLLEIDLTAVNKTALEALTRAGAFDSTGHTRAAVAKRMEALSKWAAGEQADRRSGQGGLFGGTGGTREMVKIMPTEEWPEDELLANEKGVLGFVLTVDPVKKYSALIKYLASLTLEKKISLPDGTHVSVAGVITSLKLHTLTNEGNNQGKKMALFKIRTLGGTLSAVLFVKELETYREYIEEDRFCVFKGTLDLVRDVKNPCLKVSSVATVEESLKNGYSKVILRLGHVHDVREEKLEEIREAARRYPGETDLILSMNLNRRKSYNVRVDPRYRVDLKNACISCFQDLAGPENLELR